MQKATRAVALGIPLTLLAPLATSSWVSAESEQHTPTATTTAQTPAPHGTIVIRTAQKKDFPGLAKVSLPLAMRMALGQVPGDVLKAETREKNGFLVHEVEVVAPDKSIVEFTVDAGTGAILRQAVDHSDDKEQGEHEDDNDED